MAESVQIQKLRAEKLRYIKAMLGELRKMADEGQFDLLTYMIEMAYVEASDIERGARPSSVSANNKRDKVA